VLGAGLGWAICDVNETSIIEAWRLWLSGDLSLNATLWGMSILWWGRIGKFMQFFGAATIIADIIGPEEIRHFGISLQNSIPPTTLIQFLRQCFNWYTVIFRQTILKDYPDEATIIKPEQRYPQLDLLTSCTSTIEFLFFGANR
jgi:hypothetical protein